jgi:hypothetical protein
MAGLIVQSGEIADTASIAWLDYAREEFELKHDRKSGRRLRRSRKSAILDFDFLSRLAPPSKQ